MTGSMYAAIAGLRTHMQNLNVIGHNIANVNTESYKSARSVFKTSIYSTTSGGSDGTAVVGGRNPSQIGYGSNLASVDIDMSTGTYKVTGKSTDLMLDGDGFFLVGDKTIANNFDGSEQDVERLTSLTLTRLGSFDFKSDGYLSTDDGNVVYGFLCTGVADKAYVEGDAAATPPIEAHPNVKVGDPIFSDQLVPIRYPRVETITQYYDKEGTLLDPQPDDPDNLPEGTVPRESTVIRYPVAGDGVPLKDATKEDGSALTMAEFTGVTFDEKTGLITATSKDTKQIVTIGCLAVGSVTNPNGVTQIGNSNYQAGPGSGNLVISTLGGASENMGINYVNGSLREKVDGEDAENIDGLRIRYSPTSLKSNGLESSKADLAQEIANMIVTQRGYQANTRIITVTDSMLEELVNMKR